MSLFFLKKTNNTLLFLLYIYKRKTSEYFKIFILKFLWDKKRNISTNKLSFTFYICI